MKGLLKGLRYISSHIFDHHEKEPEMTIGMPTDVKHVAHIGWDGPSTVNSAPSWMKEFKEPPPAANGGGVGEEDPVKCDSQDNSRMNRKSSRGKTSSTRDRPELPKSSKSTTTSSINGLGGSSTKEKTDKAKPPKKSRKPKDPNQETESTSSKKTSRRKKLKDSTGEGSSRRYGTVQDMDTVSESESQVSYYSDFGEREDI